MVSCDHRPKQASRAAETVKKILILATELGHVSHPCKLMGLSRHTFYRDQNAMTDGGVEALIEANPRKPNPKNRVDESTEASVMAYATEQPTGRDLPR